MKELLLVFLIFLFNFKFNQKKRTKTTGPKRIEQTYFWDGINKHVEDYLSLRPDHVQRSKRKTRTILRSIIATKAFERLEYDVTKMQFYDAYGWIHRYCRCNRLF